MDLLRARLLCPFVLWRGLCHHALFCARRFRQRKDVHDLRRDSDRLGPPRESPARSMWAISKTNIRTVRSFIAF